MSFSLIPVAMAATNTPQIIQHAEAGGLSSILLLVGFVVIFYFLLWRPQSKRAKEQKELVSGLAKGDEVVTNGGIFGKITKVSDEFMVLTIADGIDIKIQKSAVATSLPKGTIKSL